METPTPNSSTSPPSAGASWRSVWGRRLSWLISALSGTLDAEATHRQKMSDYEQRKKDYEQRKKDYEQENAKLDAMIWQTRNDVKQIENENARLAELESKIDGLFSKYNINLPTGKTPEQP
jgi:septal ring factor EnvC (AmiA/AmiB activator)